MMKSQVMIITPKMAKDMLSRNCVNRTINRHRVDAYAADMVNGNWKLNGEGICFNKSGQLVNGQHRLSAVVKANIPVRILVCTDVNDSDAGIYDRGRGRNASDTLKMLGYDPYLATKTITSVVALVLYVENHKTIISDSEIKDFIDKYVDTLKKAKGLCVGKSHNKGSAKFMRTSVMIAAMFYALHSGISEDVLDRFTNTVYTGFYEHNSQTAAIVLRNDFINGTIQIQGQTSKKDALCSCQKAIYDYANGVPRKRSYAKCNEQLFFL